MSAPAARVRRLHHLVRRVLAGADDEPRREGAAGDRQRVRRRNGAAHAVRLPAPPPTELTISSASPAWIMAVANVCALEDRPGCARPPPGADRCRGPASSAETDIGLVQLEGFAVERDRHDAVPMPASVLSGLRPSQGGACRFERSFDAKRTAPCTVEDRVPVARRPPVLHDECPTLPPHRCPSAFPSSPTPTSIGPTVSPTSTTASADEAAAPSLTLWARVGGLPGGARRARSPIERIGPHRADGAARQPVRGPAVRGGRRGGAAGRGDPRLRRAVPLQGGLRPQAVRCRCVKGGAHVHRERGRRRHVEARWSARSRDLRPRARLAAAGCALLDREEAAARRRRRGRQGGGWRRDRRAEALVRRPSARSGAARRGSSSASPRRSTTSTWCRSSRPRSGASAGR